MNHVETEFSQEVRDFVEENYNGRFSVSVDIDQNRGYGYLCVTFEPGEEMIPLAGYAADIVEILDAEEVEMNADLKIEDGEYELSVERANARERRF